MSDKLNNSELIKTVSGAGKELAEIGDKAGGLFCKLVDCIFGK